MNKSLVIDASVAAKWLLPDEQDFTAKLIKDEFAKRAISIYIPALLFYEVNNLLKSAALAKRIKSKETSRVYEAFLDLDFNVYWSKQILKDALKIALKLNLSSYDAAYVALAEDLQIPFYTADGRLVKQASNKLIKSLDEFTEDKAVD